MITNKLIILGAFVVTLTACTNKQLYQSLQENAKSRCQPELNEKARAECLEGLDRDYSEYKRERDKLLQQHET